jgi:TldD protein
MKKWTDFALDLIKRQGAIYGDVRIVERKDQDILIKNGIVESNAYSESLGIGVRVIVDGAWGFASTYNLTKNNIKKIVKNAIDIAKSSAKYIEKPIKLAPSEGIEDEYISPYKMDPFSLPDEEKIGHLLDANKSIRIDPKIIMAFSSANFRREVKIFTNTEGSFIKQTFIQSGGGISCVAFKDGEIARRSYPASFGGDFRNSGWEFILEMNFKENGPKIAGEAIELLTAPQLPHKKTTLVIGDSQLALQIHESVGHPTELDRVLGFERSYAGTSFVTLDKLYELQYGSNMVNIVADATDQRALGGFAYDDEGIPAQSTYLIKDGLFVGYQTSRETAPIIGQVSNGCMRADGFRNIPLIRMTSINLLPGDHSWKKIISEIDNGFYFDINKSWSIDDKRLNFQFGCEIAYEIKNGKLGKIYKNPTYTGITPEFWNSCDAIGSKEYYRIWGIPNCGKGEPPQTARVSHGASFARFKNVEIGVGEW